MLAMESFKWFSAILYLSATLGLFPYSLKTKTCSKGARNFSIILMVLWIILGTLAIYDIHYVNIYDSLLNQTLDEVQVALVTGTVVSSVMKFIQEQNRLSCLLNLIQKIQCSLQDIGYVPKISAHRQVLGLIFKTLLTIVSGTVFKFDHGAPVFFFHYLVYLIQVKQSEAGLLLQILQSQLKMAVKAVKRENSVDKVVHLSHIKDQIIKAIHNHSRIYEIQRLLTVASSFIIVTATLFCWLKIVFSKPIVSIKFFLLGIIMINEVLQLARQSTAVKNLVASFDYNLFTKMIHDSSYELTKNERLRIHLAQSRELTISAYRFFNIDNSLIQSLMAAVTTYIVILIQLGLPKLRS